MFGGSGVEADVMEAPVVPLFTFEDRLGVVERRERLLSIVVLCVVMAKVDQRIGFGLGDMVTPGNLGTFLIVRDRLIEVPEFAVNPANRVRHATQNDVVAIAPGHLHGLTQSRQRLRHAPLVA